MSTLACDCGNDHGHRHGCAIFKCSVCGELAPIAPQGSEPTYCEKHCPDHDYQYERGDGWHCVTCHAEPPHDWFDEF